MDFINEEFDIYIPDEDELDIEQGDMDYPEDDEYGES